MTILDKLKHWWTGHTIKYDLNSPSDFIKTECLTCGKMLEVDIRAFKIRVLNLKRKETDSL